MSSYSTPIDRLADAERPFISKVWRDGRGLDHARYSRATLFWSVNTRNPANR